MKRRKAEWTTRASSRRATVLLERFEVSKFEWELAAGSHTTTSGVWCGVVGANSDCKGTSIALEPRDVVRKHVGCVRGAVTTVCHGGMAVKPSDT
jgi:hypothetical protein